MKLRPSYADNDNTRLISTFASLEGVVCVDTEIS
jgi:hypothetical protein